MKYTVYIYIYKGIHNMLSPEMETHHVILTALTGYAHFKHHRLRRY